MAEKLASTEVDYEPSCPHCDKQIREIHWRRLQSWSAFEYVYICPHCRKVLGISAAKG